MNRHENHVTITHPLIIVPKVMTLGEMPSSCIRANHCSAATTSPSWTTDAIMLLYLQGVHVFGLCRERLIGAIHNTQPFSSRYQNQK
jgi:hypothetical protein